MYIYEREAIDQYDGSYDMNISLSRIYEWERGRRKVPRVVDFYKFKFNEWFDWKIPGNPQ